VHAPASNEEYEWFERTRVIFTVSRIHELLTDLQREKSFRYLFLHAYLLKNSLHKLFLFSLIYIRLFLPSPFSEHTPLPF